MQDRSLDMETALTVMRESANYGVSMFPDDSNKEYEQFE
jgi:hypothetical protein